MKTAVILTRKFAEVSRDPIDALVEAGFTVEERDYDRATSAQEGEICRAIQDADVLIVTGMFPVTRKVLESSDRLRMVAIRSAGFEGTDIAAATERGVVVTHNPGSNASSVADMAIGLMLAVSKQIARKDREIRKGLYNRGGGEDLFRKTVGIIGLGHIGKLVAKRLQGFEVELIANDIVAYPDFTERYRIRNCSKEELLGRADFVTLHVPLDESTRGMIDEARLGMMKPGAFLINTCRGPVIEERALYNALVNGRIAGAGLDVFENEPPRFRPLLELENVVSTPHSAGLSREASYAMAMDTVEKVIAFFAGKVPEHVLNPDVLGSRSIRTPMPGKH